MKTLIAIFTFMFGVINSNAQEIFGKVLNEKGEPAYNVAVRAVRNGNVYGVFTDEKGGFRIGGLEAGKYLVSLSIIGYNTVEFQDVEVSDNQIKKISDIQLDLSVGDVGKTIIINGGYVDQLIDINGGTQIILRSKDLKNLPAANGGGLKAIVATMDSGIKQSSRGDELYFRGSRSGSVVYFIDGVKIYGQPLSIPSSGISSVMVYTGGVPAKYGDSTGGYVVVNTKSYIESLGDK
jgi:Carboxypeptidase regulatory-like domain/TonB-dependent Receptor Plug Domain